MNIRCVQDHVSETPLNQAAHRSTDGGTSGLRCLIVADHASLRFGGEAALPLHYFRVLRKFREEAWLVVHERTRDELLEHFPNDQERIHFVCDNHLHRLLWNCGRFLPRRLGYFTFGMLSRLLTQLLQRRIVRQVIAMHGIDVVHQPMPVSPREPSMLFNLRVPVIIGPMNGGMDYPPAFADMQSRMVTWSIRAGRFFANLLNTLIPGKRRAGAILVANARTRAALPSGIRGPVIELVENGVDLDTWRPTDDTPQDRPRRSHMTRFIYIGRLVDWKAVDILLEAFHHVTSQCDARLEIVGDGPEGPRLRAYAHALRLTQEQHVQFSGFLPQTECARRLQQSDVLVLPSLLECGGAVVLEAMAMARPVIATNWGGPADYLDDTCGILIEPTSHNDMVRQLGAAMLRLNADPELCRTMGEAGRRRVLREFDWDVKVRRMLDIYREVVARAHTVR
mgnify:CR=1 FL=1